MLSCHMESVSQKMLKDIYYTFIILNFPVNCGRLHNGVRLALKLKT